MKSSTDMEKGSGEDILRCLKTILERCADFDARNRFPGEGGERRFRMWLATDFLTDLMGWPAQLIVQGERFDLLLEDEHGSPLLTFETKTPYHETSAAERRDFVGRLSAFPTLRTGVLTNGDRWEIYRIEHTLGSASVHPIADFRLDDLTPEGLRVAVEPLVYRGTFTYEPGHRYRIARSEPFIAAALLRLTGHLEASITDLQRHFVRLFHGVRSGEAGADAKAYLDAIYERWSGEALRVSPAALAHALHETLVAEGRSYQPLVKALNNLGFSGMGVEEVVEAVLAVSFKSIPDESAIMPTLWPVFEPWIRQLCAQTAHVQLARLLLYRVGEDEGIFEKRISGEPLASVREHRRSGIGGREYRASQTVDGVRASMESLLPSIYKLSEFDWWLVRPEYRAALPQSRQHWLQAEDESYNALVLSVLNRLEQYDFRGVDIDVWRNLYENYLPADERQRLGGFYTPGPLVDLTLDLAGYTSDAEDLCKLTFIDPSCGSGAFVTTALGRLLAHLAVPMSCHAEIHSKSKTQTQKTESLLRIVARNVNAIDIHPFASFLTTLNVLFAVLPRYVQARESDPDFVMEFNIFAWDTLDPPTKQSTQPTLFAKMNARSQRGEHDYERYRTVMENRFDRVLGNPPWGGVLKGPLAPVYDIARKKVFKKLYESAAQGKYDVYALFMERSLALLREGGSFALITQATWIEKDWAAGLRALLASETTIDWIVDLNPFGQLFFKAMNAPCITVITASVPKSGHKVGAILSAKPKHLSEKNREQRQIGIAQTLREVAVLLPSSRSVVSKDFASGVLISQTVLQSEAAERWNLARDPHKPTASTQWHSAGELLEVRQGVTPGNALELFLLDSKTIEHFGLEDELVHRAIKSRDLGRWSLHWHGRVILYPYVIRGKKPQPAFHVDLGEIADATLAKQLTSLGLKDALDFDIQIDDWEKRLVRQSGVNKDTVAKLLSHRIALGLVRYPNTARYLCEHYAKLEGRVFKHKNIRSFNREWYEMIWPRDPKLMLAKQRILSPTLVRQSRFVLDGAGHLSDHACLFLQPTKKTNTGWRSLTSEMQEVLGRKPKERELLLYCLAFLNSSRGSSALLEGRRPTPKGSYQVSEQSLKEIFIAPPRVGQRRKVEALLAIVDTLTRGGGSMDAAKLEAMELQINEIVDALLQATT